MSESTIEITEKYLKNIVSGTLVVDEMPANTLTRIVGMVNGALDKRNCENAAEQLSTEALESIRSRCATALAKSKFDVSNDNAAKDFSNRLSNLIAEIHRNGYKVWYSPNSNKLYLSKQGLIIVYRPDGYIDSNKALLPASLNEIESMEDDDYQLVPEEE